MSAYSVALLYSLYLAAALFWQFSAYFGIFLLYRCIYIGNETNWAVPVASYIESATALSDTDNR